MSAETREDVMNFLSSIEPKGDQAAIAHPLHYLADTSCRQRLQQLVPERPRIVQCPRLILRD